MSPQGENVIIAMIGVVLLLVLIAGFVPFGAPVAAVLAPVPLILFIFGGVRKDLRHVRRHGWNVVHHCGWRSAAGQQRTSATNNEGIMEDVRGESAATVRFAAPLPNLSAR